MRSIAFPDEMIFANYAWADLKYRLWRSSELVGSGGDAWEWKFVVVLGVGSVAVLSIAIRLAVALERGFE